jgi:hypothetical protein
MTTVMSRRKPRTSTGKGGTVQLYELSIYSYEDDDNLRDVARVVKRLGFKTGSQTVRRFYMPHSGTELCTTQLRLKLLQDNAGVAIEKAHDWFNAVEAKYGWDVRFEPCAMPQIILNN